MKPFADWPNDGPLKPFFQKLREMLTNNLTFNENMMASVVTLPLVHGTENQFERPKKFLPLGFFPISAVDSSGNAMEIEACKFNARPSNGFGWYGVTADYNVDHAQPFAELAKTAAQTLTTATFTPVTWDSNTFVGSVISVASNSRVTVSEAGNYIFTGHVAFAANAVGQRNAFFTKNGAVFATANAARGASEKINDTAAIGGAQAVSSMWSLAANDYIELWAYQSSGGNLNIGGNSPQACQLQVARLWNASTPSASVTGILVGG